MTMAFDADVVFECPWCGSSAVRDVTPQDDGQCGFDDQITCDDCGKEWLAVYERKLIEVRKVGE